MTLAPAVLLLGAILLNDTPPATVVVSATFWSGRGPCELLPDGSRRWALLQGFTIRKVHRGSVRSASIGVEPDVVRSVEAEGPLVEGREYVLFLRPSEDSLKALGRPGPHRFHDALAAEEVLSIVDREALEKAGSGG
jgi:hypothetical protein